MIYTINESRQTEEAHKARNTKNDAKRIRKFKLKEGTIFESVRFIDESSSNNSIKNTVENISVNLDLVYRVEKIYGKISSTLVKKLVSNKKAKFFNSLRLLSNNEIIDASEDLKVNFAKINLIPIFDCGDNDFIVYHVNTNKWSKFNIVDETVFEYKNSLYDFF